MSDSFADWSPLDPGSHVLVRRRFDGEWVEGFDVLEPSVEGYRLLRKMDGVVLPTAFPPDEVRPAPGPASDPTA